MAKKKPAARKSPAKKPTAPAPAELSYIAEALRPLAVPIESLTPDPRNARKHGDRNLAAIGNSLARFGQLKPIVVNRLNGVIEAGNGTLAAARSIGWTHLAVVYVEHDATTQTGFALADNRTAELAEWDDAMLVELALEVKAADQSLFDDLAIEELLALEEAAGDAGPSEPLVAESYQVIVQCADEAHQRRVYDELTQEGLACKVLTL